MASIVLPPDRRYEMWGQALGNLFEETDAKKKQKMMDDALRAGQTDPQVLARIAGNNPKAQAYAQTLTQAYRSKVQTESAIAETQYRQKATQGLPSAEEAQKERAQRLDREQAQTRAENARTAYEEKQTANLPSPEQASAEFAARLKREQAATAASAAQTAETQARTRNLPTPEEVRLNRESERALLESRVEVERAQVELQKAKLPSEKRLAEINLQEKQADLQRKQLEIQSQQLSNQLLDTVIGGGRQTGSPSSQGGSGAPGTRTPGTSLTPTGAENNRPSGEQTADLITSGPTFAGMSDDGKPVVSSPVIPPGMSIRSKGVTLSGEKPKTERRQAPDQPPGVTIEGRVDAQGNFTPLKGSEKDERKPTPVPIETASAGIEQVSQFNDSSMQLLDEIKKGKNTLSEAFKGRLNEFLVRHGFDPVGDKTDPRTQLAVNGQHMVIAINQMLQGSRNTQALRDQIIETVIRPQDTPNVAEKKQKAFDLIVDIRTKEIYEDLYQNAQKIPTSVMERYEKNKLGKKDFATLRAEFSQQAIDVQKKEAKETQSSGPKPGDIEGGYKFRGGDPSKAENWEKE